MGCLVGYTDILLPKLLFSTLTILGFIRDTLLAFFRLIGFPDFLEPDIDNCPHHHSFPSSSSSSSEPEASSLSAELIREMLPVAKFSDIGGAEMLPEGCAVCLYDFEGEEEIRRLPNCGHVFHRSCLDRWMDHDRTTCPLCRTHFVPEHLREDFDQRLSDAASAVISHFYAESS